MMFLRRKMRKWYERGRTDAIEMGRPNPFVFNDQCVRWAYDAGFRESMTKQRMRITPSSTNGAHTPPPASKR